ncbi:MarR family winged helix-turn-helix transcriptional regulator [Rhodalgimonas zhirmunskyi]|uniref:MarR family transcriptional regulator n=1 Tax=Rhodalgimonas zhirmunskyi TaxID=2964767 RepID=A0AAJ1U5E1_9RHOB|nr:MarR family transcriptional regulator [Rhodoalgimonas zhirmunskyi]MDQ2093344.1 MarR family transcriptional regulator [Rhodoalgimonas zhirmunskyi]
MMEKLNLLELPGHLIRRLQQQSTSVFQERMKAEGFDLTSVQFAVLNTLGKGEGLDQASVAKRIAYDRATIGGVIKRLEQKGLVTRTPDDEDRRAFKLNLTEQGKDQLAALQTVVLALQKDILSELSETEAAMLLELMMKAVKSRG